MVVPPFDFALASWQAGSLRNYRSAREVAIALTLVSGSGPKMIGGALSEVQEDVSIISPERLSTTLELLLHCTADNPQSGGAASKYQDLTVELESLEPALSLLYTLKPTNHELVHLEAIRAATTACERQLESFLAKLEKLDKRLGTRYCVRRTPKS